MFIDAILDLEGKSCWVTCSLFGSAVFPLHRMASKQERKLDDPRCRRARHFQLLIPENVRKLTSVFLIFKNFSGEHDLGHPRELT